jgi:hypothetical protein
MGVIAMNTKLVWASSAALLTAASGYLIGARANAPDSAAENELRAEISRLQQALDRRAVSAGRVDKLAAASLPVAIQARQESAGGLSEPLARGEAPRAAAGLSSEQQKTRLRQEYGVIFHDLSLSEAQTSALLDALSSENRAEQKRKDVEAAIGHDKAIEFERERKTLFARVQIRHMRNQLEEVGEPLTDEQQQKLGRLSEQLQLQLPTLNEGDSMRDFAARFRRATHGIEKDIQGQIRSVLTPVQRQRLTEIDDADSAERASTFASRGSRSTAMAGTGAQP